MGKNPSHFSPMGAGKDAVVGMDTTSHPVETVSWNDAAESCAKLSEQEKLKPFYIRAGETVSPLDGTGYRLPTESEWEFACRAGTTARYWIGDQDHDLAQAGWFNANSGGRTHAVGKLKANPFGLYDIHGNVWEWVQDWWEPTYHGQLQEKPAIDPSGPSSSTDYQRVVRGGTWFHPASASRASSCDVHDPVSRLYNLHHIGFRLALTVDAVKQRLDPDRRAAEWVLSIAGTISIMENGKERQTVDVGDLPRSAFELTVVHLDHNTAVTDAGLAHFKDCKNLTVLRLQDIRVSDAGLAHFKDCKNLTALSLGSKQVSDAGLAHFKDCKNLTHLHLAGTQVTDAGLVHFRDCRNLQGLSLNATHVSDAGLEHIKSLNNLNNLSLHRTKVTAAGVASLQKVLPNCNIIWSDPDYRAAELVLRLEGHRVVISVDDVKREINSASEMPHRPFRVLGISGTQITDDLLSQLPTEEMTALNSINLAGSAVTDAGAASLSRFPRLQLLHLSDTKITDQGLKSIVKLGDLIELDLVRCPITDAGLRELERLSNLRVLRLNGTKITSDGVKRLGAALPECQIISDHGI